MESALANQPKTFLTPEEYLEVETLVPRAQAMALAILRLRLTAERA